MLLKRATKGVLCKTKNGFFVIFAGRQMICYFIVLTIIKNQFITIKKLVKIFNKQKLSGQNHKNPCIFNFIRHYE